MHMQVMLAAPGEAKAFLKDTAVGSLYLTSQRRAKITRVRRRWYIALSVDAVSA